MHLVARRAAEFGVEVEGDVRFRLERAVARKDEIVARISASIHANLDRRVEAIEFIRGRARFVSDHEVDTGERVVSFAKAIIATGARPAVPSIPGLESVEYLTNRSALDLETLPDRLVIIGGGYVGIEFAQMYGRFGSRVTLLSRSKHLAPGEDPELSEPLAEALRGEGIEVLTGAAATAIRDEEGLKTVTVRRGDSDEGGASSASAVEFVADEVLVAAGRVGNTDSVDAEAAGVELREGGFVEVDEQLRTSRPHIWAIGDVKGGWMFTHVATYDGPIAALNAVKDVGRKTDCRVVPRVLFTDPALAAVGMTEAEARSAGYEVLVGSVPATGARAMAMGETVGRIKAVVNKENGEILGYHMLAHHADDLLHEVVAAMHDHGRVERISKSIHVHPTLSEMVKSAAKAAE